MGGRKFVRNLFKRNDTKDSSRGDPNNGIVTSSTSLPNLSKTSSPTVVTPPSQPCATIETTHSPITVEQPPTYDSVSNTSALLKQHEQQTCDKSMPLPSSSEASEYALAVPDLWQEAFENLPEKTQRELSPDPTRQKPLQMHIHDLLLLTKAKQEECERKFVKFEVGNREILLRDLAVKTISCLQSTLTVAAAVTPPQVSIPCYALQAMLKTAVLEDAQMCALLAAAEKIVRIINRGQVYEAVYITENTLKPVLENLRSVLVELYGASMELLANSSKLLEKNTARRTAYAILHPGESEGLFSKLHDLETKLDLEARACEAELSATRNTEVTKLLQQLNAPLTRVDQKVDSLIEKIDRDNKIKMLEWISRIPFLSHHETVKERRTSDTCEWLLRHKRFCDWEDSSSSVILWLQGSPGAGKTFLTSKVIDHIHHRLLGPLPNHEGFAFFYCNRNESERRDPLSVIQSYVRQLSNPANKPGDMRTALRNLCHETRTKGGSSLSFDTCKEQLLQSVNLYPKTTIVLDALDECEPDSRGRLIDAIEFLLSSSEKPLKIFISSRPDRDIKDEFLSRPNIEIKATDNQDDIEKFVRNEILQDRRWQKISPTLQIKITQILLERSNGMFQWANLQIKQLLKLKTERDIEDRLGKLPDDLKSTYHEIYNRIEENKHQKAIADRAFKWVMCAVTPLESVELLSAIRLDTNGDNIDLSDEVNEDVLLDLCNNLLVLDSQQKVWRFAHLSVREYFEKNKWKPHEAQCYVAKVCLGVLLKTYKGPDIESDVDRSDNEEGNKAELGILNLKGSGLLDPKHPLQKYIRRRWIAHVQTQENQKADTTLARLLKDFLGSPNESSPQYRAWYRQIDLDRYNDVMMKKISPGSAAVFGMCHFSFYTLLSDWWTTTEIELSQINTSGTSLLSLAAAAGSIPICRKLIERGMQVNIPDNTFGSALAAAADGRETETVKFLVEKGADINMPLQTGDYGSALAAAAGVYMGKIETVKFLVEKGADINMPLQTGYYGSALAAAASRGETETVKFLVEKRADINMPLPTGHYGSALAAAAEWGKIETVKFLVEKGADINMPLQTGYYGSALAAAAYRGQTETVEFLVEKGADINMPLPTGRYGSALAAAALAYSREIETVKFLVEKGADINMPLQTGDYGSALTAAAHAKETETVKFLVEKGADINMPLQTGRYDSALAAAVDRFDIEAVEFLVEKGADINKPLQTGNYGSILARAAGGGDIKTVKFLVEKGADINMPLQTGRYGSALAAALEAPIDWRKPEIIKFLVEKGADTNILLQTGEYSSALVTAAERGEVKIIKFLITVGTHVDKQVKVGEYGTALVAAAYWGRKETVEALLEAGAEVNAKVKLEDGTFHTALQAAYSDISAKDKRRGLWHYEIKQDKDNVAKLLLQHGAVEV